MSIDFQPLLSLPRKEKLTLVRMLVESLESEEPTDTGEPRLTEVQLQKIETIISRIESGEISFYPWQETRERLYKQANE